MTAWEGRDREIVAVLDVIAPHRDDVPGRWAIFEWAHEEDPTDQELVGLAERIVDAIEEVRNR